jgi:hypothetical protein
MFKRILIFFNLLLAILAICLLATHLARIIALSWAGFLIFEGIALMLLGRPRP